LTLVESTAATAIVITEKAENEAYIGWHSETKLRVSFGQTYNLKNKPD